MNADPNAFLMSSGARSFKFDNFGDTVKGTITDLQMEQQRDLKTKAPKFWNDDPTQPMMQLRVTLETDDRDPTDPNDDGTRSIYIRGDMQRAVREAIKAAGAGQIEVGAVLTVRYESNGPRSNPAFNPPKLYRAKYEARAPAAVAVEDL